MFVVKLCPINRNWLVCSLPLKIILGRLVVSGHSGLGTQSPPKPHILISNLLGVCFGHAWFLGHTLEDA